VADDPSTTSGEYNRMEPKWRLVSDIMAGVEAIRARRAAYLPKYEVETQGDYERRLYSTPWRPEFADILQTLTSKPFGRDVALKGNVPDEIQGKLDPVTKMRSGGLVDDIDGRGNSLTTFASEAFSSAVAKGAHAILVDHPPMPEKASRADEIAIGARPYWVQVPFDNIIALYTDIEGGREVITHVRIRECRTERDGYGEKVINQIRVLEPGTSEVFEQNDKGLWVSQGRQPMVRGGRHNSVPLALCFLGKRLGTQEVRLPLQSVADMSIELFQALSRYEEILTYAGSPMLAGNGISPPGPKEGQIAVGPKTILFATRTGDGPTPYWDFVQPKAENITAIKASVEAIQSDMRRIGLQPLTEQPGNPTATGKAIDAAKAHSAVKSWALLQNDAIEQAMVFTAQYLGIETTIQTEVSTDFSVLPYAAEPLKALLTARATKDISHETLINSLKRFDVLAADFDVDTNEVQLRAEAQRLAAAGAVPAEETIRVQD
jgi:hypothetical protein